MKKINSENTKRTSNARPYGDLSVSCAATSPRRRGFCGRAMLAPTGTCGNRKGREGKGGFTMVELVVALVIIAIVSLATVSLIITQNNLNLKSTQVIEATNVAENAIECFRFAVNTSTDDNYNDDFVTAFNNTLSEENKLVYAEDGIYSLNVHGATIKLKIDGNTIYIEAIASDGETIIDDSYTKTK